MIVIKKLWETYSILKRKKLGNAIFSSKFLELFFSGPHSVKVELAAEGTKIQGGLKIQKYNCH